MKPQVLGHAETLELRLRCTLFADGHEMLLRLCTVIVTAGYLQTRLHGNS